mmetsp:Transcript_12470/g.43121  ORF Transcript_12470/g.43121 Transcript_12470/m.43121 type:complete len:237 (-) Transcript_12470:19-729(-)
MRARRAAAARLEGRRAAFRRARWRRTKPSSHRLAAPWRRRVPWWRRSAAWRGQRGMTRLTCGRPGARPRRRVSRRCRAGSTAPSAALPGAASGLSPPRSPTASPAPWAPPGPRGSWPCEAAAPRAALQASPTPTSPWALSFPWGPWAPRPWQTRTRAPWPWTFEVWPPLQHPRAARQRRAATVAPVRSARGAAGRTASRRPSRRRRPQRCSGEFPILLRVSAAVPAAESRAPCAPK